MQRKGAGTTSGYAFYDYLNLELPTPIAPPGLSAAPGNAQVTLIWQAAPGATGYNLQRSTTNGGAYALVATLAATNYTDTAVLNGTNYFYVVSATNASAGSGNSPQVGARPVATNSPPLTFSPGGGQMSFTWPSDHAGWSLQVQTNPLTTGLGTNWVTLAGSSNNCQAALPVTATNGSVFFRLVYP